MFNQWSLTQNGASEHDTMCLCVMFIYKQKQVCFIQSFREEHQRQTCIFRMKISFFAAFRTFLPSFFRNFLQVYIFSVFLSLALKTSQNSSLKRKAQ